MQIADLRPSGVVESTMQNNPMGQILMQWISIPRLVGGALLMYIWPRAEGSSCVLYCVTDYLCADQRTKVAATNST